MRLPICTDRQERGALLIRIVKDGFLHSRGLGFAGAIIVAAGGALAGVPPTRDSWGHLLGIRELRTLTVLSVLIVYIGLAILLTAWWRIGGLIRRPGATSVRELVVTTAWWAAPFTLVTPIFSGDVYSYLAQGAMTTAGIDAYTFGPAALGGPLAANVPAIWQHTPAPYGPVFLGLASGVTQVTGHFTWPGIIGMRALAVVGVCLLLWSVPRLARSYGVEPTLAVWLGVVNPVVLLHLVADAHNDALMLGLMAVGLVLALQGRPALGAVVVTFAALVKAPAGLAIAFLVPIWAGQLIGRGRWVRAALGAGAVALATVVLATALSGTGYGWIRALGTPARAHTWLSISTDLGDLTGRLAQWLGVATVRDTRLAWQMAGLAVGALLCLFLWRRSLQLGPVVALGLCLGAFVVFGPVVHPWYLLWGIVPLAATAASMAIRRAVALLSAALVLLVLPGGVEPGVSALAGAALGTAAVLGVLFAVTGLDRGHLWAPLAASPRPNGAAGSAC
jgi:hypothetical protein